MIQSEQQQLKKIANDFTKAIELFRNKDCKSSFEIFSHLVDEYENSEYYSVLEIQGRAKVYKNLCESRLTPVKIELKDDEDYLNNGVFLLNSGNMDEALERFEYLEKKNYKQDYLNYLISLVYLKKGDIPNCLKCLKASIQGDEFYKVVAYNEPDFEHLFENEDFINLVED